MKQAGSSARGRVLALGIRETLLPRAFRERGMGSVWKTSVAAPREGRSGGVWDPSSQHTSNMGICTPVTPMKKDYFHFPKGALRSFFTFCLNTHTHTHSFIVETSSDRKANKKLGSGVSSTCGHQALYMSPPDVISWVKEQRVVEGRVMLHGWDVQCDRG